MDLVDLPHPSSDAPQNPLATDYPDYSSLTIICTHAGDHPYAEAWWPDAHIIGYEHAFINQASDILRVLAGKKPILPLPDFADAYKTQRVLEAALISAKQKNNVKLSRVK